MALRLQQRTVVIIAIVGFLLLGGIAAGAVWYLNYTEEQVAPDDTAAGICCNSFSCNNGTSYGEDYNYEGGDCSTRHAVCDGQGGVAPGSEGNQCENIDDDCGGPGEDCCQPGNGCLPALECNSALKCEPSGGACNGIATCDNNGCSCSSLDGSCSPIFADFHCSINGSGSNQIPTSCNDANDDPEAEARNICKVIQYDVSQCNGTNANVVWIDDDGTRCSSNDGGLEHCLALPDFSLDGCAPTSCTVTEGHQCLDNGMVRVNWNASATGFTFGADAGRVVVRIDNTADGWFTQGSDIWWSTHNQEFVASGQNPASGSWDFNVTSNTDYTVRVSVDQAAEGSTAEGMCTTPGATFNCAANDAPTCNALSSSSPNVINGDRITLTATVQDSDNNMEGVEFRWAPTQSNNNYCAQEWNLIGSATNSGGNTWTYNWNVSGIPNTGAIVVYAIATDQDDAFCTGNPSGICGSTGEACSACALTLAIDTPICTGLSLTGDAIQNGNSATITMNVSDPDSGIASIPIYWAPKQASGDYCASDSIWTLIGNATKQSNSLWSYTWNISGLPSGGEIVISANPSSVTGTIYCSGNPSGSCGGTAISCPTCNESLTVTLPPEVPNTAIFDSTQNKIIGGFVLIALSIAYMLFDGFDRIALNAYRKASNIDISEKIVEVKTKRVESNRSSFEKKLDK